MLCVTLLPFPLVVYFFKKKCVTAGVMIAWTGIEHFRLGRYDPPPPPDEAEDAQVCFLILCT